MHRILLLDHDPVFVQTTGAILRNSGFEVEAGSVDPQTIEHVADDQADVALINIELPVVGGIEILRELRGRAPDTRCVLVADLPDMNAVIEGLRLGACDYLQKPLAAEEILASVRHALQAPPRFFQRDPQPEATVPHALTRWCDAVLDFICSPRDAKNLVEFGRAVGISSGGFRNWCRTASLSPRRSLGFARALRAVSRQRESATPENLLKIVDLRTLAKFLRTSGGTNNRLPATIAEFLDRQQFINNTGALSIIRDALAEQSEIDDDAGHAAASARLRLGA